MDRHHPASHANSQVGDVVSENTGIEKGHQTAINTV